ncbi:MAG TPA: Rieske 2Fe-2S domain-containing protein [Nitrospiraceae bacterium]|nr:Rieske 2Fe-2S domain-containing protein [Nitrospiraceae bacterium]
MYPSRWPARRRGSRRVRRACPWHGWQYDVTTGVCVANPAAKVEVYQMQVDGTDVKVLI